jgi:hypothetical protein
MIYTILVDLDELIKVGIHDFSSWDHLDFQKLVWCCQNLKIQNNKFRSRWVQQNWYSWLSYLEHSRISNSS